MAEQTVSRPAAVVALPDKIDSHTAGPAYDQLYVAFAAGATVVIADFSATTVCDPGTLRRLLAVRNRAAARDAEFRLVAPPGSPVRGALEIMGAAKGLEIYSTAHHAAAAIRR